MILEHPTLPLTIRTIAGTYQVIRSGSNQAAVIAYIGNPLQSSFEVIPHGSSKPAVFTVRKNNVRDRAFVAHNAKHLGISEPEYLDLVDFCEAHHNLTQ